MRLNCVANWLAIAMALMPETDREEPGLPRTAYLRA